MHLNSPNIHKEWEPSHQGDFLVVIRCGAKPPAIDVESLRQNPRINLMFLLYDEPAFECRFENSFVIKGGLSKFHAFRLAWDEFPSIRKYMAYWLVDADIEFDAERCSAMIDEGLKEQLHIWQPGLSSASYSRWRHLFRMPTRNGIRRVNFIEVMAPVFSNDGLRKCLKTFTESISTWGLDFAWSRLADCDSLGVSDTFEMTHRGKPSTRDGAFYRYLRSISVNPYHDNIRIRLKYRRLVFRPDNNTRYYVNSWLRNLLETDASSKLSADTLFSGGRPMTPVFFLNHHSLYTLARQCVAPPRGAWSFADGIMLARHLRLAGGRVSFDFTGGATTVIAQCIKHARPILFVGGAIAHTEPFRKHIQTMYPELRFHVCNGYQTDQQIDDAIASMEFQQEPHVIVLGLGTPRQEILATRLCNRSSNSALAIFTCGGFMTQTSQSTSGQYYPKIVDRLQLRWAWRMVREPHVIKRLLTSYIACFVLLTRTPGAK